MGGAREGEGLSLDSRVRLQGDQALSDFGDGEGIVLDLGERRYRGLNETALFLLKELSRAPGGKEGFPVAELVRALSAEYDVDAETARRDVVDFLEECLDRGVIELLDG